MRSATKLMQCSHYWTACGHAVSVQSSLFSCCFCLFSRDHSIGSFQVFRVYSIYTGLSPLCILVITDLVLCQPPHNLRVRKGFVSRYKFILKRPKPNKQTFIFIVLINKVSRNKLLIHNREMQPSPQGVS